MAKWDPAAQRWSATTPIATNLTPTTGHSCVMGVPNYPTSGCEHFGVGTYTNGSRTIYRWLLADPNNPGQLIPAGIPVAIPAPIPPKPAQAFGDAQWMKVYKTENNRMVGLDELVADNPVVPQDAAQIETGWYLVQARIGGNGNRKQKRNQGALGNTSHAVVRRYEFYNYASAYDPLTHEALCADVLCNAPAASELGTSSARRTPPPI